jgi:probable phosphoglycerate mutase
MANAAGIIGEPETPLAEEGIEQARKTGQDLRLQNVTLIACSPFLRAQQTAEIIAGETGVPIADIKVVEELHERRMGTLEGHPKDRESIFFTENDADFGFETHSELIARSKIAIEKVKQLASQTSGSTVVVGHGCAVFFFEQVAKGRETFAEMDKHTLMNNAEFIQIELAG